MLRCLDVEIWRNNDTDRPDYFTPAHAHGVIDRYLVAKGGVCEFRAREGWGCIFAFIKNNIMASKSFTALPSVVSIYAEKTAVQMRCYSRGFEKITWPIVAIMIDALALVSLAVAAGTPMWVEV